MKRLALSISLCLLAVLSPVEIVWTPVQAALAFPYKTLEDSGKDADGVDAGSCAGEYGAVMAVSIPIRHMVLYIGDGKLLVGEWLNAETFNVTPPAFLWVGTVGKNGEIVLNTREPYSPEKHGTGPCRLLYPERYI
jgi:hypothetical protein